MERWLEYFARVGLRRSADTAHDLKTPLNVAVLNLELLRMRLRKLVGEDEKISRHAADLELELRRMGRIFDTFFLLSTPPEEGQPAMVDISPICVRAAAAAGYALQPGGPAMVLAHESRIRQAFELFFLEAAKLLGTEKSVARVERAAERFEATVSGTSAADDLDLTKVFKLYYSDPDGNPDLSLATARLIAETYGGELIAQRESERESDNVSLRLSFPLGAE